MAPNAEATKALDAVEKLRDRFSAWGAALASVCVVLAVWVTAPAQGVDLPLVSETKVKLNVGYVLALAMPAITIVYAWMLGSLVTMRRYQAALPPEQDWPAESRALASVKMRGGLFSSKTVGWFEKSVAISVVTARLLVLFGIPFLAEGWIAIRYFGGLQVYPEYHLESKRPVLIRKHLLGFDVAQAITGSPELPSKARFSIVNGDFEGPCQRKWTHPEPQADTAASRCVLDEFPRFVLPLTSWVNLFSLVVTACLSWFGAVAYVRPPLGHRTV